MKTKKKTEPTVTLRVRVTPELRAALAWNSRARTLRDVRRVCESLLSADLNTIVEDHWLHCATGPDVRVDDLELSVRAANALDGLGIRTAGEPAARSEGELRDGRYVTAKVVREYRAVLAPLGLKLRGDA